MPDVIQAILAVHMLTGLPVPDAPLDVQIRSECELHQIFRIPCDGERSIAGLYLKGQNQIYMSSNLRADTVSYEGYLVHEVYHWFQDHHGMLEGDRCQIELQAFEVQFAYVISHPIWQEMEEEEKITGDLGLLPDVYDVLGITPEAFKEFTECP